MVTSTAAFTSLPANSNEITIGEDPSIVVSEFFDGKWMISGFGTQQEQQQKFHKHE
ncbi:MAG: hypothetical protein IPJ32_00480 [Sphingobacteriaceae bacterium]|nr:hypothetical protein [Sphingobacteriaceae bacterium]